MLNEICVRQTKILCQGNNKDVYRLHGVINDRRSSAFDLTTYKLWYAIVRLFEKDYESTLSIVNKALSDIPPFVLFVSHYDDLNPTEADHLYVNAFLHSEIGTIERARQAWMCIFIVDKTQTDLMPLAIQIELYFCWDCYGCIGLSPFVCLYYLMFLCYHERNQYGKRDRALRQVVDVANNVEQCGTHRHHSYNIAGHCLLVVGDKHRAREMFSRSYKFTSPPFDKVNSANWYLQHFC